MGPDNLKLKSIRYIRQQPPVSRLHALVTYFGRRAALLLREKAALLRLERRGVAAHLPRAPLAHALRHQRGHRG